MEELLKKIGELLLTNVNEITDIKYVDEKLGAMFYIYLDNGKKVLLSLVDSKLYIWRFRPALLS